MSQKERENFYRQSILIVDYTKDGLTDLIEVEVVNNYSSFEDFINKNQHDIYHLCYHKRRCCQCTLGYVLPQNRILHPSQLELLFDKHGSKLPCHNPGQHADFCCCLAKVRISLTVLDVTLARCILINFCNDVFWNSCFTQMGVTTLEDYLNKIKHDLYHFVNGNHPCCQCFKGYKYPVQQKGTNQSDWRTLFGSSHIQCANHTTSSTSAPYVCSVSATPGISTKTVNPNLSRIILENFCSLRKAVDTLILTRNSIYGHATEAKISNSDFAAIWSTTENALLVISKATSAEQETKQKLADLQKRCLDETLLEQYRVKILEQIQIDNNIQEGIDDVKETLKKVKCDVNEIKETLQDDLQKTLKNLQNKDHIITKYTEDQEIKRKQIQEYTEVRIQQHVDEKTYVSTDAEKVAMKSLQDNGMVVIVGIPGVGKTQMGLELMRQYFVLHKNYFCLQIDNITELNDIVNVNDDFIILCDDIFGKTNCNFNEDIHSNIISKIQTCIKSGHVKLIITMRDSIKHDCFHLLTRGGFFKGTKVLNVGKENQMSKDEKRKCLINHLRKYSIEVKNDLSIEELSLQKQSANIVVHSKEEKIGDDILEQQSEKVCIHTKIIDEIISIKTNNVLGFPESCFLFASNRNYLQAGVKFFERANEILCQTIFDLHERGKKDRQCMIEYTILVYVLLNGDKIDLNKINKNVLMKVCSSIYSFSQNKFTAYDIKDAVSRLHGQMLKKYRPNIYSFQHRATLEAVLLSYQHFDQSKLVPLMDYMFIIEFARPEGYQGIEGEVYVNIQKKNYREIANKVLSKLFEESPFNCYSYVKEIVTSNFCRLAGVDFIKEMCFVYDNSELKISQNGCYIILNTFNSLTAATKHFDLSVAILLYTDDNDVVQNMLTVIHEQLSVKKLLFRTDLLSALFIILCHTQSEYKAIHVWKLIKTHQIYITGKMFYFNNGWRLVVGDLSVYQFMMSIVDDHKLLDLREIMSKSCQNGYIGIVDHVLQTIDHSLFDIREAMNEACYSGKVDVVKLFLETFDHSLFDGKEAMNEACYSGEVELVKLLLETFDHSLFDVKDAVNKACYRDKVELVKLLLETFDHSLFEVSGSLYSGKVELVKILLETFDHSLFDVKEAMNKACYSGKVELVKLLLETVDHSLFNVKEAMNKACYSGKVELVRILLETFDHSLFDAKVTMNLSCRWGKVLLVKLLLETFDYSLFDVKEAMNEACYSGKVELVKLLLETFDHSLFDVKEAMKKACDKDEVELVNVLLETFDHSLFDVEEAMNKACYSGNVELVQLLLETFDHSLFDVKEVMIKACYRGKVELVKILLETFDHSLFDVKVTMNLSCRSGKVKLVKLLLETFDYSLFDVKEAMNKACYSGKVELVKLLLETVDHSLFDVKEAMNKACDSGNVELVQLLLETFDHSLFDVKEVMDKTCYRGKVELVKILLETFDHSLFDVKEAMNKACYSGKVELVKLLLETVDHSLFDVKEAMNKACYSGKVELVRILLETFNHSFFDAKVTMNLSCRWGKVILVKLLLETFDYSLFNVKEAMNEACYSGRVELVKLLLETFDHSLFDKKEVMDKACSSGEVELVNVLLESFDHSLFDVKSAMNQACDSGDGEVVKLLLERFDHTLVDVKEAMNKACKSGSVSLIVFIINRFDKKLLHLKEALNTACKWQRVEVTKLLLKTFHQNDFNIRNAMKISKRVHNNELVTMLQEVLVESERKRCCLIM